MVVPIEKSLLYVLPVYLESTSTKIPELKRVIVSLGNEVAMEPTLNDAIAAVAGAPVNTVQTLATSSSGGEVSANMTVGKTGNSEQVKVLVEKANSQYDKALDAQKKGNWAEYGRNIDALKQTLAEIKSKLK